MTIASKYNQLAVLDVTRVAVSSLRHRARLSTLHKVTALEETLLRFALRDAVGFQPRSMLSGLFSGRTVRGSNAW